MGDMLAYYYAFIIFLFGLVFGSFLNCASMRIVRKEDFIRGRSRCRDCGQELKARDLIPVASWIISGGKCRYCGAKISVRYPASEILFALLAEGLYIRYGLGVPFVCAAVLTGCLFVLSLVDIESFEIPDGCLVIGFIAFLAGAPFRLTGGYDLLLHLSAGIAVGGGLLLLSLVMDAILKKESLGGGDIKLFALLGTYFGFAGSLFLVLLSCAAGLLLAAGYKIFEKDRNGAFPFGPAIAAAGYAMLLFGEDIIGWYMGLIV